MSRTQDSPGKLLRLKPQITTDGSKTYLSEFYRQTYHSCHGAETEARHVFLQNSGIATRLAEGRACSVLELGFGLGLNYLLTADHALSTGTPLSYVAYENNLVSAAEFSALDYENLVDHPRLVSSLASVIHHATGTIKLSNQGVATCELTVHTSDIVTSDYDVDVFDAIYLDAFSPATNPECWTQTLFHKLHRALKADGTLATYCVKGSVRRALEQAGFRTQRVPGPPGKREVLKANPGGAAIDSVRDRVLNIRPR